MKLFIPGDYKSILNLKETEKAIKLIKDFFQQNLSSELKLRRVTAPLFVLKGTGINDDLNGIERPVSFNIKDMDEATAEVVHSLAKWKRMMLADYGIENGYGIYTDMNALRPDEELTNIHSIYVDQWDWEKIVEKEERNEETLISIVKKIYKAFKNTEKKINKSYKILSKKLPDKITFITTQELEDKYPDKTSKEREDIACKEYGAVFIMKIGGALKSGEIHDGRAPDYDDWELNGDIVLYNELLDRSFEVSSMGIRVDEETLEKQLAIRNANDRKSLPFHNMILNKKLPYTVGGGIGQSRLCMFYLEKAHVGEVQASVWSDEMIAECTKNGIELL
ncbi:MAG: aspartate--ammonia ligase [Candidatus Heimdallarchaeota archaeon]|nr:aspartate--ammonia ligase [Candidatus Heimdallarchaeota archaeon]